jgi:hypothetical protein
MTLFYTFLNLPKINIIHGTRNYFYLLIDFKTLHHIKNPDLPIWAFKVNFHIPQLTNIYRSTKLFNPL